MAYLLTLLGSLNSVEIVGIRLPSFLPVKEFFDSRLNHLHRTSVDQLGLI
jgi:hypothetical protein